MNIKEWLEKNDLDKATAKEILNDGIAFFATIAGSKQTPADEKATALAKVKEAQEYLDALNAI